MDFQYVKWIYNNLHLCDIIYPVPFEMCNYNIYLEKLESSELRIQYTNLKMNDSQAFRNIWWHTVQLIVSQIEIC